MIHLVSSLQQLNETSASASDCSMRGVTCSINVVAKS
jgi:hypothetical protein